MNEQTTSMTDDLEAAMTQLRVARRTIQDALRPMRRFIDDQNALTFEHMHNGTISGVEAVTEIVRIQHVARLEQMVNDAQREIIDPIQVAHGVASSISFEARQLERYIAECVEE